MNRRVFIKEGSVLATGFHFAGRMSFLYHANERADSLYEIFKNPPAECRPFVRWWWNGDRIEKDELARELRILKDAGIGGVEINPVRFPARTDDLGKKPVQWLSPEWIDLLKFTLDEARSLGLVCDLIVGSGWPYGGEWLEGEDRLQAVVIGTKKLEGPLDYEVSLYELYREADPPISSPFPGRLMEILSVQLAPAVIADLRSVRDLSSQIKTGTIRVKVPEGKHVLYALVRINGFMEVIQGAPGATGPVLNHYHQSTVSKYLRRMSDAIQNRIGPLKNQVRSLFTDSLELEGANWCTDMPIEFQKRRGYDLLPYLPFILYRIAGMGNTWEYDHGSEHAAPFKEMIDRVRYDFELTKTELLEERFAATFRDWCKTIGVKSRVQQYGRGYFPLEGNFGADIPECETWIRPGLGTEISETDYRVGRAYTVVNKFVSSAAHLQGKRLLSCEELTNIHLVFNESLDLMKVASDQSLISGTTHSVLHGFNYSPSSAPFPGWVLYGSFISERNPWWPYFRLFTEYKARLSAVLQQATMFADIAILPATADLWSQYGAQNDPFPAVMHPPWQTLVWEAIHGNGGGCDYLSEYVINQSIVTDGFLTYGPRKYHSIFLTQVESMEPSTAKKLFEFAKSGGRIFFIEAFPSKASGWLNHEERDRELQQWIGRIKDLQGRCFLLEKPGTDPTGWYKTIQSRYQIAPYVRIDAPGPFIKQVRYQAGDTEILVFVNSDMRRGKLLRVTPNPAISSRRQAWAWDPETGTRHRCQLHDGRLVLDLAPSDLKLLVFDQTKGGSELRPSVKEGADRKLIADCWTVDGRHVNGNTVSTFLKELRPLEQIPEWADFCGSISYKNSFDLNGNGFRMRWINLGKVFGVTEIRVNGQLAGVRWYGDRVFEIEKFLKDGNNEIEVRLTTTMGNYMKSLKENRVAQFWTNEGRTIQPVQPIGMLGPVMVY